MKTRYWMEYKIYGWCGQVFLIDTSLAVQRRLDQLHWSHRSVQPEGFAPIKASCVRLHLRHSLLPSGPAITLRLIRMSTGLEEQDLINEYHRLYA